MRKKKYFMQHELANLVVYKVAAINRVNRALGSYVVRDRPYCAICYKITGRSEYVQNGNHIPSDENRIVFIPAGATYKYTCYENGECVIVDFVAENICTSLESYNIRNKALILSILDKLERAHTFRKPNYQLISHSGLYQILYYMAEQDDEMYASKRKKRKIQEGITYLENNYSDFSLSVSKLAEISGVSEIYFRKLFTEIYGMPPKKYISLVRLSKAKDLLRTHEISIQQIADEVGFNDVYSFCKAFKKAQNCTPSEYRKAH